MKPHRALPTLAAIALAWAGGSWDSRVAAQQTKPAEATPTPSVEPIDPRGEPNARAVKAIPGPKVCVAFERDGWQIQCLPGNNDWTRIDGIVEVDGGEIARVSGFADLETATPGRKNEHADEGKFTKRRIDFRIWVKKGGQDTFRFYLTEGARTIRCRFRIANQPVTETVLIGRAARHPSRPEFALDAHPERLPARKDAAGDPKAKPDAP